MANTIQLRKVSDRTLIDATEGMPVRATITQNGYFKSSYDGRIVGFTVNGRVKVKSWRGTKIHSANNVTISL